MYEFKCSVSKQSINKENCDRCSHPRKNLEYCKVIKKAVMQNNNHKVFRWSNKF